MSLMTIIKTLVTFGLLGLCGAPVAMAEMPDGLPNRDSYAVRKTDGGPCRFRSEYEKLKNNKKDPRVAYLETGSLLNGDVHASALESRCLSLAQQNEDTIAYFDGKNGFLQLIHGEPFINESLAYFSGKAGAYGVMLYVSRDDDEWTIAALQYREGKWSNESAKFIAPLGLIATDALLVPQYGRTLRVMSRGDSGFHHKAWLTWNGSAFVPLKKTTAADAGWRCPASYQSFDARDRQSFCQ